MRAGSPAVSAACGGVQDPRLGRSLFRWPLLDFTHVLELGVKPPLTEAVLLSAGDWLMPWREVDGRLGLRTFACRANDSIWVLLARSTPLEPGANAVK